MTMDEARQKNVCYRCGQPGHIGKFCPNVRRGVRQLVLGMSTDEKRALREEVNLMKESDFEDKEEEKIEEGFVETSE